MSVCRRTTPTTRREASVMMEESQEMLGIWRTGVEKKICLSSSKALCWRGVG